MRKYLLIAVLTILFSLCNLHGYYSSETFIDFLVQSNQLRIRTDRLGVLHGTDYLRVAVGLTSANSLSDYIFHNINSVQQTNAINTFVPSALVGIGYEAGFWGIGFGYEFTYKNDAYMVHTPIITATALDDNFRINVPVQIGIGSKSKKEVTDLRGAMVISTGVEARYYIRRSVFSHLRLYLNYGNSYIENVQDKSQKIRQQSVGFQARLYFQVETDTVLINPIIRIQYDQALATSIKGDSINKRVVFDNFYITAKGFTPFWSTIGPGASSGGHGNADTGNGIQGGYIASIPESGTFYATEPYRIGIALPVGFTATSQDENIHFYLEPALSFTMINAKKIATSIDDNAPVRKTPFMALGYVVYGELYIRPVKNLEWYFELQTGGVTIADSLKNLASTSMVLNANTGLTYYF